MDFRGFVYLLQERSEMFCKTTSAVLIGMSSEMITVETDVSGGLPYFDMVGYLSAEVKEAKERVRTAVRNAGFKLRTAQSHCESVACGCPQVRDDV